MSRKATVILLVMVAGCGRSDSSRGGAGRSRQLRFPVEVATVEPRRVEYTISATGSIEAYERVHVAARVAGAIEAVRFREGDFVKRGQPLAQIDAERYAIAVRSAKAVLDRAEAEAAEAKAGLERREQMVRDRPGLVPIEEIETWHTKAMAASASAAGAQAAVDQATLNLGYAYPSALASGVIETRSVETGQYVQPGALLATLIRRDPLLLRFFVAEPDARSLHKGMAVKLTADKGEASQANITHVGQVADVSSRLVQITAEVNAGPNTRLRPGTFVEVSVSIGSRDAAAMLPQIAVRPSERGFLAYVVEGDIARERVVSLGMRTADGLVEAKSGVQPGDVLVIRGVEALRDGVRVTVQRAPTGGAEPAAKGSTETPPDAGARKTAR